MMQIAVRGKSSFHKVEINTTSAAFRCRKFGTTFTRDQRMVTKPFGFSELHARLSALRRRPPLAPRETILRVADLEMDSVERRVTRAGKEIDLLPRELKLLKYLMQNAERLVTRSMILEHVWEFHFDPRSKIIETHISRLRTKIDKRVN
jgi:two-component system OmpR family response regulator